MANRDSVPNPNSRQVDPGQVPTNLDGLIALVNELRTDYNALCAKLDADAGVTDTNYAALAGVASPAAKSPF